MVISTLPASALKRNATPRAVASEWPQHPGARPHQTVHCPSGRRQAGSPPDPRGVRGERECLRSGWAERKRRRTLGRGFRCQIVRCGARWTRCGRGKVWADGRSARHGGHRCRKQQAKSGGSCVSCRSLWPASSLGRRGVRGGERLSCLARVRSAA